MKALALALLTLGGCASAPPVGDMPRVQFVAPLMQARCLFFCKVIVEVVNAEGAGAEANGGALTLEQASREKKTTETTQAAEPN